MLLHFLQRILKTLPWTLSSEIEYLAWQASQTIFMGIPVFAVHALRPPSEPSPWRKDRITNRGATLRAERVRQPDRFASIWANGDQAERDTGHLGNRLNVGACALGQVANVVRFARELLPTLEVLIDGLGARNVLGVGRRLVELLAVELVG